MTLKIGLKLIKKYSINFDLPERNYRSIKFVIIHYTGMQTESKAINRLLDSNSKVSTHYFIKNNGLIINMVPDDYVSWHAGKSFWKKNRYLNKCSIGIEINNPGHKYRYKNFSIKQISSLVKLLKVLVKKYNIKITNILGHSDIAPSRKIDPGEKFPWKKLAQKKLAYWHNLDPKKIKIYRGVKLTANQENIFLKNLYRFGYCRIKKMNFSRNRKYLTKAFQRRFRQELVDGNIDKECFLISKSLQY
mgnify:CR=1 FL=1|jgi:N-acetylmuramoyl-L-alanine amidase|tara:strand:- start:125 stop:865 length:741 start_codon:yes stop_codon:yes gene_type:complete